MAQNPLNDLAGRLNKAPKGVGIGLKLLALGGATVYGINQSMYTGKIMSFYSIIFSPYLPYHW